MSVVVFTLGFCPARVLEVGMGHLYRTAEGIFERHYFLDQDYPLDRERNKADLHAVCKRYGMRWVGPAKDRGLAAGWTYLMHHAGPGVDVILGYDPDAVAVTAGWDRACVEVMRADQSLAVVSLLPEPVADNITAGRLRGHVETIAERRCFFPDRIDMVSISAWRADWMRARGGMVAAYGYYGQIEIPLWRDMARTRKRYCYLLDHLEGSGPGELHDLSYREWKRAHIAGDTRPFREWLMEWSR